MAYALDMNMVEMDAQPDLSHKMGEWSSTIVVCASNDRFGRERECEFCGAQEVFAGGAGSHYFDEDLMRPCHG